MRRQTLSTFVMAFILLAPLAAWAEDLYVGQADAGAANGTSCANQHSAAWFNTAANWGGGAGEIDPADTVHFCGTITSLMTVQASGTVGNVITLLFETNAKLSQPVCSGNNGCINLNNRSYLVLDGGTNGIIESTANGTSPTYANQLTSIGVTAFPCSNCEIKNLTIQNLYVHTTDLTDVTVDYSQVNAIKLAGSNTTIHHNTIHDAGWAIYQNYGNGDSGVEIHHNEIYNSSHGWTVSGNGAVAASNFKFYNNHIYNYSNWDTTANAYHHDGIHAFGIGGAVGDQYDIYNNLFEGACGDNMTGHIFLEGGASGWTSTGTSRVFNNVLLCSSVVNGILQVHAGHGEIYDNTIVGAGPSAGICLGITLINGLVKNNATSGCMILISINAATTFANVATDLNYNAYVCGGSSNCFNWNGSVPFQPSFATWKALCGCDGNSSDNASLLVDATGAPQTGSPLINTGISLSSLGITALNSDKAGLSRPQGSAWDIGAYEFNQGGAGQSPDPPSGGSYLSSQRPASQARSAAPARALR